MLIAPELASDEDKGNWKINTPGSLPLGQDKSGVIYATSHRSPARMSLRGPQGHLYHQPSPSLPHFSTEDPCRGLPSEIMTCRAPGWLSWLIGPTLDFGSGHDHGIVRLSPASGSVLSKESVCLSPSAPPPAHALT